MKASGFLHCAFRSPDPVRIGKFYADLFECGFFIHPILSGLEVVIVKIANPKSVFRGILEFWPPDIPWEIATAPNEPNGSRTWSRPMKMAGAAIPFAPEA